MNPPRPRTGKNRTLPENLYPNGKYWRYRNPITGVVTSINKPMAEAIKLAKLANAKLAPLMTDDGALLQLLTGEQAPTTRKGPLRPLFYSSLASLKRRAISAPCSRSRITTACRTALVCAWMPMSIGGTRPFISAKMFRCATPLNLSVCTTSARLIPYDCADRTSLPRSVNARWN